jgi:cellulose synthase/poly-beta-1,6-N-acetylglucosamine synthase-like glycosyltransferase
MEFAFTILSIFYLMLASAFFIFWKRIKYYKTGNSLQHTMLSVIIPVRNESSNILNLLEDLNAQTYPFTNFEVIIVNDNSSDNTTGVVRAFIRKAKYRIVIVDLSFSYSMVSSKKKAIETGVGISRGKLMVTTDGDCRVGPEWLKTIEGFYIDSNCKLIAGGVSFHYNGSFFKKLQMIEFASLIGSGAASLQMGFPNMCNGANLAYEKQTFVEVNGFLGNENIPSGDDEFLMHKIYNRYPNKVMFLKNPEAVVETDAKSSVIDFIHQRKRWASKWSYYSFMNIKILALFIFAFNLTLLVSFILLLFNSFSLQLFLILILPKIGIEYLFLRSVLRNMNKKTPIPAFLFLIFFYPFYIVLIGLISKVGGYEWKGRKVR